MKNNCINYLFLILIFISSHLSLSGQCNRMADSLELVKLYNSLDGPNWNNYPNWLVPNKNLETWYGLRLNSDGCVSEINLSKNSLSGRMYNLNFSELTKLDLSQNYLTGDISNFYQLPKLTQLHLNNNQLEGIVPNFDHLLNLTQLFLNNNKLKGIVPNFDHLPKLTQLNLSVNELSDTIPNFNQLPNLTLLNLGGNKLSGSIPNFNNMPNLGDLILGQNELSGSIPDFYLLKLNNLWLGGNKLIGSIPNFNNMPNLKILHLDQNQLSGPIPNFDKIPNLIFLSIRYNQLTGEIPNFDKTPNLLQLILTDNKLTGSISEFNKLTNLTVLLLNNNQLTGNIPNFPNCPNLVVLEIFNNQLSGNIPNFNNIPKVITLNISSNLLTGNIPNFNNISNLENLHLSNNKLIGSIPDFVNFPNLKRLYINNNQLTGAIPNLENIPSLLILYLNNNYLSDAIPNFDSCKNLFLLFVHENNFTFKNLKTFTRKINFFEYSPQLKFYKDTNFTLQKNQDLSINLQIDSTLTDNSYKWTNNINRSWTMDPSQDTHSNTYTFKNLQTKDAGRYTVKVTNPSLRLLTLESNTISIKVCNVQQDSSELVNLYNGTSGTNWKIRTNWLQSGKPISTWHGISTTAEGCVRSINLDNNNLIGSIPALDLNTLDTLILSNNQLNGNIPEMKIPFIKYINMRNNALIGAFPAVIHDWMNLGGLDLGNNNLKGPIPPDIGDICELQELKLDSNIIEGELPEELTKLQKLQRGRVNFSNNIIDTLKEKIIFFCPFGDSILVENPSYNRFLGICNRRCSGTEWNMLKDFPWIADTIGALRCKSDSNCVHTRSEAGFVKVRGINVVYTQNVCCADDQCNDRTVETRFYDCGGKRLETAQCGKSGFCTSFGAISMEEFDRLVYDKKWQCGDTLSITTDIKNIRPKKYIFNSTSQQANCYPNPVNEILTCEIEGKLKQLTVSDLQGKECKIKSIKQNGDQLEIDFSGLPSGIYFMEIWIDSGRSYRKVIKGE